METRLVIAYLLIAVLAMATAILAVSLARKRRRHIDLMRGNHRRRHHHPGTAK